MQKLEAFWREKNSPKKVIYVSLVPIHSIMRLVINCVLSISYSDSSKQRTRLRAKLTVSKAELKECINGLKVLHPEEEIDVEAVEQGTFPWLERSRQGKKTCLLPVVVGVSSSSSSSSSAMDLYKNFQIFLPRAPITGVEGKWVPIPFARQSGTLTRRLKCCFPTV